MLKWTSEPPNDYGYYWFKSGDNIAEVVEVFWYPFDHVLVFNQPWNGITISVKNAQKLYKPKWAGPIPEPEE